MLVAVSTAGVIETTDGGETWQPRNKGMLPEHTPEPDAEWGHDTHYIEQCKGDPDHVWQQNHVGIYIQQRRRKELDQGEPPRARRTFRLPHYGGRAG